MRIKPLQKLTHLIQAFNIFLGKPFHVKVDKPFFPGWEKSKFDKGIDHTLDVPLNKNDFQITMMKIKKPLKISISVRSQIHDLFGSDPMGILIVE